MFAPTLFVRDFFAASGLFCGCICLLFVVSFACSVASLLFFFFFCFARSCTNDSTSLPNSSFSPFALASTSNLFVPINALCLSIHLFPAARPFLHIIIALLPMLWGQYSVEV